MTDLSHIEAELLRCAEVARSKGLDIVCGAYIEQDQQGSVTGVCAIEAYRRATGNLDDDLDLFDYHIDQEAVAQGFDDQPKLTNMLWKYYNLGARLRQKLSPRPARV